MFWRETHLPFRYWEPSQESCPHTRNAHVTDRGGLAHGVTVFNSDQSQASLKNFEQSRSFVEKFGLITSFHEKFRPITVLCWNMKELWRKYEGNMKKHEEIMKEYDGNMKEI